MKKVFKILGWIIGCLLVFYLLMSVLQSVLFGSSLISWWFERIEWIQLLKETHPTDVRTGDKIYLAAFYAIPVIMILSSVIIFYRKQLTEKFKEDKNNTKDARIEALEQKIKELEDKC